MVEALDCKPNQTRFESAPVLHMEGTAEWSASRLENGGLVMSQWGSIPLLSSNFWKADRVALFRFAKPRMRFTVQIGSIPMPSANGDQADTGSVRRSVKPLPFGASEFESQGLHQCRCSSVVERRVEAPVANVRLIPSAPFSCPGSPTAEADASNTSQ